MTQTTGEQTMAINAWVRQPGNTAAKQFIASYPTPRELRDAIDTHGWGIITTEIRALPWAPGQSIGQMMDVGVSRQDVASLHDRVREAARDVEVWTAQDGTVTIREI